MQDLGAGRSDEFDADRFESVRHDTYDAAESIWTLGECVGIQGQVIEETESFESCSG